MSHSIRQQFHRFNNATKLDPLPGDRRLLTRAGSRAKRFVELATIGDLQYASFPQFRRSGVAANLPDHAREQEPKPEPGALTAK